MRLSLLLLASLALTVSCKKAGPETNAATGPLTVCVSIPPLVSVVKAIAGDGVQVTSLMSAQDDPHTFSPTPQTIASLREANVFLTVGVDYEKALAAKIAQMFPDLTVLDVARGVKRCEMAEHHHDEAEHEAHGEDDHEEHLSDPHVWLSLPNLMVIADSVQAALAKVAPEQADKFSYRLDAYKAVLTVRNDEFASKLSDMKHRSFCVYHPVFGYFSRDYKLHQATVEIDGKSPSPRQLKTLLEEAEEEGFKVVFVQPQFNERPAQTIAERIGGKVVRINPLDEDPVSVLAKAVDALAGN
jgi:zinc transport system substrate-binding protein